MEQVIIKNKKYTVLKILSAVGYGLITLFMLYVFFDALSEVRENGFAILGYVIILVMVGICYLVPLILSTIGLILSAIARLKGESTIRTVIYFIVFTALPLVSWFIFLLLSKVLG